MLWPFATKKKATYGRAGKRTRTHRTARSRCSTMSDTEMNSKVGATMGMDDDGDLCCIFRADGATSRCIKCGKNNKTSTATRESASPCHSTLDGLWFPKQSDRKQDHLSVDPISHVMKTYIHLEALSRVRGRTCISSQAMIKSSREAIMVDRTEQNIVESHGSDHMVINFNSRLAAI